MLALAGDQGAEILEKSKEEKVQAMVGDRVRYRGEVLHQPLV
jgi:hypothetical protein